MASTGRAAKVIHHLARTSLDDENIDSRSIVLPKQRMTKPNRDDLIASLINAAARLSGRLV